MATQTSTSARFAFRVHGTARPNMRLKLPRGERSNGSGVLCAGAHELSFNHTAPCGRVGRSLSAIR